MSNPMRVGTILNTFKLVPIILQGTLFPDSHTPYLRFRHRIANLVLNASGRYLRNINHDQQKLSGSDIIPLSTFSLESQIKELREAGAEHFEFDDDIIFLRPEITQWWQEQMPFLVGLKKEGVTFSRHLSQFGGLQIDSFIPEIRQASVQAMGRMIKLFEPLDPLNYVLHLGSDRFFRYLNTHAIDPVLKQELKKMFPHSLVKKYILRKLIGFMVEWTQRHINETVVVPSILEALGELKKNLPLQKICLENLENSDFDIMADMVTRQADVRICFDVGHNIIRNGLGHTKEFILKYGRKIAQVHLHDVKNIALMVYPSGYKEPVFQDHKPLGEGVIKLKEDILIPLKKVGFSGPIVIEDYYHDPVQSVKILKQAIKEIS